MKYKYIGELSEPGWKKALPHYLVTCEKHGEFITYPQGYDDLLICWKCRMEEDEKQKEVKS